MRPRPLPRRRCRRLHRPAFTGGPAATANAAPTAIASGTQIAYRGRIFGVGAGPGFYGVWDLRMGGPPVARFDDSPTGWQAAWAQYTQLERTHGVPPWRSAKAGWILLHIAIGFVGLWFAQIFVAGMVVALAGRTIDRATVNDNLFGGGVLIALFAGGLAWMLFVYLRKPRRVRLTVFLGLLAASLVAMTAMTFAAIPPA